MWSLDVSHHPLSPADRWVSWLAINSVVCILSCGPRLSPSTPAVHGLQFLPVKSSRLLLVSLGLPMVDVYSVAQVLGHKYHSHMLCFGKFLQWRGKSLCSAPKVISFSHLLDFYDRNQAPSQRASFSCRKTSNLLWMARNLNSKSSLAFTWWARHHPAPTSLPMVRSV